MLVQATAALARTLTNLKGKSFSKNANTQILRNLSPFLDDHPDEGGEGGVAELLLQVRSHPGVPSEHPSVSATQHFWSFLF